MCNAFHKMSCLHVFVFGLAAFPLLSVRRYSRPRSPVLEDVGLLNDNSGLWLDEQLRCGHGDPGLDLAVLVGHLPGSQLFIKPKARVIIEEADILEDW